MARSTKTQATQQATQDAAVGPQAAPATPVAAPTQNAPQGQLLVVVSHPAARNGTAAATCWATLVAMQGQPRQAVLEALKQAETAWHAENGRSVKGVAPSGWLRKFGANITWQ